MPGTSASALCVLSSLSIAQQQVQFTATVPGTPVPGTTAIQIPLFDSALGVLRTV